MSEMYVGNGTKQVQSFCYRLPEGKAVTVTISMGGQIKIPGNLSAMDIDAIVDQHSKYGLVRTDEIDRTQPFIGLCYSIDKPISIAQISRVLDHNDEVLTERGKVIREEAAVALNSAIEQNTGVAFDNLELSVIEQPKSAGDEGPKFAEGVRVTSDQSRVKSSSVRKTPGRRPKAR